MKYTLIIIFGLMAGLGYSQSENRFLDRAFWKGQPSIALIEEKIAEGNDPSELNRYGFDAVTYAILEKVPNTVIQHLLKKEGNGVNKLTHDKRTYVFWAVYKDNVDLMKYLIAKGAKMDLVDSHGFSVLTFAAVTGQTNKEIYEICMKNGIDIKAKDEHGASALLLLSPYLEDFTMIDYFKDKGLDLHGVDNDGNGVFNYTCLTGNRAMLEQLIKKGIPYKNENKKGGNAMLFASRGTRRGTNPLSFFQYLEGLGIRPDITDDEGTTPLHYLAYRSKDLDVLDYFLKKGLGAGQADDEGNTPLLNAAYRNGLEAIKLLARHAEDINHRNKEGHSALTHAVQSNVPEVVGFLIGKGADVQVVDANGNHLGYYLIHSYDPKNREGFRSKLEALTRKGLDITRPQKDGNTLYHLALAKGDVELLKIIHDLKVDVNAKNKEGLTALHKAAMTAKSDETLRYLLSIGADKGLKTDFDESVHDLARENEILKNTDIDYLK